MKNRSCPSKEKISFCYMVTLVSTTYCLTMKMLYVEFLILEIVGLENSKAILFIYSMMKMTKNLGQSLENWY